MNIEKSSLRSSCLSGQFVDFFFVVYNLLKTFRNIFLHFTVKDKFLFDP